MPNLLTVLLGATDMPSQADYGKYQRIVANFRKQRSWCHPRTIRHAQRCWHVVILDSVATVTFLLPNF